MLFNSLEFFIFLAVVLPLYYVLNRRAQNAMLLGASYFFYGYWDYRFLSLVAISTLIDFWAARAIDREQRPRMRKLFLACSMTANLGLLGFFKYYNFFIDSAARTLETFGLQANMPVLYVILPVGISFYTFQTMSYTIDVYRRHLPASDDLLDFALYVCYFPQLVAGPIERATNLLPAIQSRRVVTSKMVATGCVLILVGLFRKVVIADGIASQIDPVFASPGAHSTPALLKALYLFALQIYCDFAGYSDIARGTSRLMGIELMVNFNHPYFASNISDFWRRWHISLSTWLRDYLYIPLGGNRNGELKTYRNLMLTMLLGGLWHGAAWSFVVWGGLHGLYLVGYRLFGSLRKKVRVAGTGAGSFPFLGRLIGMFLTFHLVLLTWLFFRASGLGSAIVYLQQILSFRGMENWLSVLPLIAVPWLLVFLIDIPQHLSGDHTVMLSWPRLVRHGIYATLLFLVILGFGTHAPFIYFQF
ncbi:MAG: MBOAT family protein [Acidobacteria bacterium]|nr:MAG: MBOAT family protein [Acidobacteriota bacterium]